MSGDFGEMDAALARGLRALDLAGSIAENFPRARLSPAECKSLERIQRVRQALIDSGIRLPPMRTGPDPEEIIEDRLSWTVQQIANLLGCHRATVVRRIRAAGGEVLALYIAARRDGKIAMFSPDDALKIMNASE